MNNYFSYIDTSLRIVYFNIHLSGSKEYIKNYRRNLLLFENSKKIKNQFIQKHLKKVEESDINFYKLRVHEFHHYWQSIFYPFLFWLSYTEYNTLLGFSSQLKNVKQKVKIRQFGMDEDSLSNIGYLHYTFKLAWDSKIGLTHEYDNYVTVGINRFCLNDLIETATAIYQFKITEKDHDFNSFWYWVRNPKNKAYSKLYCFLNQYTDKEILFDIFPICVQLAFNTTEPVSAFCLLYNSYEYYYKKTQKIIYR